MTTRLIPTALMAVTAALLSVFQGVAWAQIQAGRAANGTLILTDQGLPNGVSPLPLVQDAVMSLPASVTQEKSPVVQKALSPGKAEVVTRTPAEKATCRSINQRYEDSQAHLAAVEQDKASGRLLIPDSGIAAMRQNLATLQRLRDLCE
ncbi:MAG: hypothetical protein ACOYBR_04070 [Fluviibacter sp.]